jgi:hypothetical protein
MSGQTFMLDDLRPSNTFERRLLQFLVEGGTIPVTVTHEAPDLSEITARLAALEQRPVEQMPVLVQSSADPVDLSPILDAIANLSERMAAIEQVVIQEGFAPVASQSFDPGPLLSQIEALQSKLSTKDAQLIKQERVLQAMAHVVDGLGERVDLIEGVYIPVTDERKAG